MLRRFTVIVVFLDACGSPIRGFGIDDSGSPDVAMPDAAPGFPDGAATDVEAGPLTRTVFLSSITYTGDLGGAAGADAKCQALAADAGLLGQYKAWVSTSTSSPSERFTQSEAPYALLTGEPVSYSFTDLVAGSVLHPINVDEHMTLYDGCVPTYEPCGDTAVWTQTLPTGAWDEAGTTQSCDNFTVADAASGHIGSYLSTDPTWTEGTGVGAPPQCGSTFPIYCFEQ
jgi:hypothetical protein